MGEDDLVEAPPGIPFTLDGRPLLAGEGELLIEAAEREGVYIPRFCYHPRMKPVGMCRMCLVEVDTGRGPTLQPSCMLSVTPDMAVHTESEVTKKAQDGVLEFLLINHPLDCPVCDKGGECPLQDQTMAYGPGESRFVEEKRHYEKPIPISDLVLLDRERCILCDRCTRFAAEVAGHPLIHFQDRGNQTQVNTFPDHPFASYFSGNTVQICPVGALTAEPYRFKARPWDLQQGESTCTTCSVGCRVTIHTSRDRVLRYLGVDIDPVNWGWLCDKGRFDFESVGSDERIASPLLRRGDALSEATWPEALNHASAILQQALSGGGIGVIGGARLTNESAYAWSKLARTVFGTDNVDAQLGDGLPADTVLGVPRATIDEVCAPGGTVLLLGPELLEELPILHLRLKHAVLEDKVQVIEVSPSTTSFTEFAALSLQPRPGEVALVVDALAGGADGTDVGGVSAADLARGAAMLATAPGGARVIVGRQSVAESATFLVDAVASLVERLPEARFLPALRRGNIHGALDMGLAPGLLPGRVSLAEGRGALLESWSSVPELEGLDTAAMLEAAASGEIDTLVLLGADLYDFPDRDLAVRALSASNVIAVDLFVNGSVELADVVLPAAGYAEVDGTTTNIEGRISPVNRRVNPPGTARDDWMIAAELAWSLGADLGFESLSDIWAEIEQVAPSHRGVTSLLLRSSLAQEGLVVPLADPAGMRAELEQAVTIGGLRVHGRTGLGLDDLTDVRDQLDTLVLAGEPDEVAADAADDADADEDAAEIDVDDLVDEGLGGPETPSPEAVVPFVTFRPPAERTIAPPGDNYSLRLVASRRLYDAGTTVAASPSLAPLASGTGIRINPWEFDRLGVADGDVVKISSSRASVRAEVAVDAGVPRGTAVMVFNQPDIAVAELLNVGEMLCEIRIETERGSG